MGWSETLGQVLQTRPLLAYGASYLGGVIATASPCILASIPLIIGFVGGYAQGNRKQAFLYSLTFVVGLALMMSALGAAAALMGTLFGGVGSCWHIAVGLVLVTMGLHLAGVINLRFRGLSQNLLPQQTGLLGALIRRIPWCDDWDSCVLEKKTQRIERIIRVYLYMNRKNNINKDHEYRFWV